MSKRTIEYRHAGTTVPTRPGVWRERRAVLIAGALLLLVLIVAFAGASVGIVVEKLAVEGVFLLLWLAAAGGYGGILRPLLPVAATPASRRGEAASPGES